VTHNLIQQDRQCKCNVTPRRFHKTIVAVKKKYVFLCAGGGGRGAGEGFEDIRLRACVSVCVCVGGCTGVIVYLAAFSLTYPVCYRQVPYFLQPLWL
jgi:hypothetical protein